MSTATRTALLIDDDPDLRKIVSRIITTDGLNVIEVETVKEAMAQIEKSPPDVIFTDLNLANESGFDFLIQYRKLTHQNMAPVIVLSGKSDREAIQKAFSLGAKEYLVKPVKAPLLLQKMRKVLKEKKFLSVEFGSSDLKTLACRVPVNVTAACEVGFQVETPVRFAKDSTLTLEGPIAAELGMGTSLKLQTGSKLAKSISVGQFLSELKFVGMTSEQLGKMKELLKRWA